MSPVVLRTSQRPRWVPLSLFLCRLYAHALFVFQALALSVIAKQHECHHGYIIPPPIPLIWSELLGHAEVALTWGADLLWLRWVSSRIWPRFRVDFNNQSGADYYKVLSNTVWVSTPYRYYVSSYYASYDYLSRLLPTLSMLLVSSLHQRLQ
jgi:hypothetical protein